MADDLTELGWPGRLVREVRVFSTVADMAVVVNQVRLAHRRRLRPEPVLDTDQLSMWEQIPETAGPPSPVRLAGVIFTEKTGMGGPALPTAFQWRGFAPTAIRCKNGPTGVHLSAAQRFQIGVLVPDGAGGWRCTLPPGPRTGKARTVMDRHLEEQLYARLLEDGHLDEMLAGER